MSNKVLSNKELDYVRSREAADGSSTEKSGGVLVNDFEEKKEPELTGFAKIKDSFRRYDSEELNLDPNLTDIEKTAIMTANSPLSRKLKNRHLQMIALGGSIGTGLFVGSGSTLRTGGPAGILIGYGIISTMILCMVNAAGELSVTFPVSGAFVTYNTRFLDPSLSFSLAWNYALQWLVVLPLELVAASMTIQYWDTTTNPAAYVVIFYVLIVAINFFGVKGYGEAEFLFSLIKVLAVTGFIILGIVLVCGGGPNDEGYIGGRYWHNPGAIHNGFKGVCSVFVTAAFAFAGTELAALGAAETADVRKSLPKATKQVFWRIALFYIISLTLVGLLVPYNDERLLGSSSVDANASPFVISIKNAQIKGLPSVMNAVIMIAVLSVGNSSVFASSRTLAAIASAGMAPKIFAYIDKAGRPLFGIIFQCIFGLLCFVCASSKEGDVFTWLLALSGLSSLFTWGGIMLCHIRFRRALYVQGRDTSELVFKSQFGVYGSYYGVTIIGLILIAQFWIALFPSNKPSALNFFENYLGAIVVLAFYIPHKLWRRGSLYIRAKDIDLDTGRRELDLDLLKQEIAEEKEILASKPLYKRIYHFWC